MTSTATSIATSIVRRELASMQTMMAQQKYSILAASFLHIDLIQQFYDQMCGAPNIKSSSSFPSLVERNSNSFKSSSKPISRPAREVAQRATELVTRDMTSTATSIATSILRRELASMQTMMAQQFHSALHNQYLLHQEAQSKLQYIIDQRYAAQEVFLLARPPSRPS